MSIAFGALRLTTTAIFALSVDVFLAAALSVAARYDHLEKYPVFARTFASQ
ncbi:MAG: hypothetical protein WBR10_17455 [Candidatus Acidiferrum sp.]